MRSTVITNLIEHICQSGLETHSDAATDSTGRFKVGLGFVAVIAAVVAMEAGLTNAIGERDSAPVVAKTNEDGRVLLKNRSFDTVSCRGISITETRLSS